MRSRRRLPHWIAPVFIFLMLSSSAHLDAQVAQVTIQTDEAGSKLLVDGEDFMILGMNWDYFPIGTTYNYAFWDQPDDFIREAVDREMALLKSMGVNTIRHYVGIPPRWVKYIYEEHGIFTVLNHAVGRYGVTVDGVWMPNTDYSDPRVREQLIDEVTEMVEEFRDTPGVLMWLLGNENNYGLVWSSAETEALPEGERDAARARHLYSLFGDVTAAIKEIDTTRPVAMANGDLQYIDIIAEEVEGLDVFGSNVYRGISFRDLFERVDEVLGVPVMLTEFGADAFDAKNMREDQITQARYLLAQWEELYEQSYGKGLVGNSIGGLTFQWSDGWWKFGQEDRLDIHDTNASWPNDAYPEDYVPGENNMNEEWWGIMAKGRPDARGLYQLYPRAAFFALREAYELDPYAPGTDLETIEAHFDSIDPRAEMLAAGLDPGGSAGEETGPVSLTGLRVEFETFNTGGERISTPEEETADVTTFPRYQGFDRLESYYAGIGVNPQPNFNADLWINLLGNVPENPIDEIFYENRGRTQVVETADGDLALDDIERLKVYSADIDWDDRYFRLHAFYRSGHYHWAYEGDFFNLYREANYGPNIDIYNGEAPLGVEFTGKRDLEGLSLAFGPELWWGSNPTVLAKYTRDLGPFTTTFMFQEDIENRTESSSSVAVPVPATRRATVHLETTYRDLGIEVGGIWGGSTKIGDRFQIADGSDVLGDSIRASDTFGGKMKLTLTKGRWNWYAQGAAMGLVADGGGYDQTQTFTGWGLKDSGSGNQWNVLTGVSVNLGNWQIGPNFLWQKPIVGPIPADVDAPGRPRNILDDPFAVRANRETTAGELVLTYDPTPATWMWAWDSDVREDASFAASLGLTFKHHPTTMDAAIGILEDGRTLFAFPGATPARDLWEVRGRIVSKSGMRRGVVATLFAGEGEPNGDDPRLIHRYGADVRLLLDRFKISSFAKINDWGPYDYHRDFNLTFPLQLMLDVSYAFTAPDWFDVPYSKFGIQGTFRTLDSNSPRYCPAETTDGFGATSCDPDAPGDNGHEWEIRSYVHLGVL